MSFRPGLSSTGSEHHLTDPDEASPLLPGRNGIPSSDEGESSKPLPAGGGGSPLAITPLPKFQLFILCLLRISEPISYTVCFPYINQMIRDLDIVDDKRKVGFYSGLIESVYGLCQLCTVFHWGSLSDRYGRKPILVTGLLGVTLSGTCFGLSRNLWTLILSRSLAGALSGNIAIVKTCMAELTDKTNAGRAFSFLPLCFAMGSIVASFIGGYLSRPAERYPSIFGEWQFLKDYPYFLPSFLAALFPAVSVLLCIFFLEETHPYLRPQKRPSKALESSEPDSVPPHPEPPQTTPRTTDLQQPPESEDSPSSTQPPPVGFSQLISTPGIIPVLINYGLLSLQVQMLTSVVPLYCFTDIEDGGLSFSEAEIGNYQGIRALCSVLMQLFAFPSLQRRLGTMRMYKLLMMLFPVVYVLYPLVNVVARLEEGTGSAIGVWTLLTVTVLLFSTSNMSFSCNVLLVNESAPSRMSLGALNGMVQMVACFNKTFSPATSNSLFAISKQTHLLGGQAVWIFLFVVSVGGAFSTDSLARRRRREAIAG